MGVFQKQNKPGPRNHNTYLELPKQFSKTSFPSNFCIGLMMFVIRHHSGNTDVLCRIIHGSLDLPKNVHIQRFPKTTWSRTDDE